jgi:hypothetical protein
MSSANYYDESLSDVAKVREDIKKIISKSAKYNDNRDMKIHGYIQGGNSLKYEGGSQPTLRNMKDVDKYILDITSGSGYSAGGYTAGKVHKPKAHKSSGSGVSGGASVPKQLTAWMTLVNEVKKSRPELPYKEVLKVAKTMYKK